MISLYLNRVLTYSAVMAMVKQRLLIWDKDICDLDDKGVFWLWSICFSWEIGNGSIKMQIIDYGWMTLSLRYRAYMFFIIHFEYASFNVFQFKLNT